MIRLRRLRPLRLALGMIHQLLLQSQTTIGCICPRRKHCKHCAPLPTLLPLSGPVWTVSQVTPANKLQVGLYLAALAALSVMM